MKAVQSVLKCDAIVIAVLQSAPAPLRNALRPSGRRLRSVCVPVSPIVRTVTNGRLRRMLRVRRRENVSQRSLLAERSVAHAAHIGLNGRELGRLHRLQSRLHALQCRLHEVQTALHPGSIPHCSWRGIRARNARPWRSTYGTRANSVSESCSDGGQHWGVDARCGRSLPPAEWHSRSLCSRRQPTFDASLDIDPAIQVQRPRLDFPLRNDNGDPLVLWRSCSPVASSARESSASRARVASSSASVTTTNIFHRARSSIGTRGPRRGISA